MRRALTLAVLAVAALAILGAGTASAKRGFFGVHYASGPLTKADLNRLDQGGVGTVRRLFYWPALEARIWPCPRSMRSGRSSGKRPGRFRFAN